MKLYLLITVFIFSLGQNVFCQEKKVNSQLKALADSLEFSVGKGDTAAALLLLERFESLYANEWAIIMANKFLADLYRVQNRLADAKSAIHYAINFAPTAYSYLGTRDGCSVFSYSFTSNKAGLCIYMSQLYCKEKQYDSSLFFLNLADSEYLPYKNCGNGVLMYRSYLSTFFADHYLAEGDTANAVARLLDFFMEEDGDYRNLTCKLKSILLQKWTQEQIKEEVEKGIRTLKVSKAEGDGLIVKLRLFGHTINDYQYGKKKYLRKFYFDDPAIKLLCSY